MRNRRRGTGPSRPSSRPQAQGWRRPTVPEFAVNHRRRGLKGSCRPRAPMQGRGRLEAPRVRRSEDWAHRLRPIFRPPPYCSDPRPDLGPTLPAKRCPHRPHPPSRWGGLWSPPPRYGRTVAEMARARTGPCRKPNFPIRGAAGAVPRPREPAKVLRTRPQHPADLVGPAVSTARPRRLILPGLRPGRGGRPRGPSPESWPPPHRRLSPGGRASATGAVDYAQQIPPPRVIAPPPSGVDEGRADRPGCGVSPGKR